MMNSSTLQNILQTYVLKYGGYHSIISKSPQMDDVYEAIKRVAPTDATVLVLGETGTGKELVARAIHENSPRKEHQFIAINCRALTDSVLKSELFGYEKGAFTGAQNRRKGYLEIASDGTLFLDEIGEVGDEIQTALLRVLDGYPFYRVGGTEPITTNARLITATNRDLDALVSSNQLSEAFRYRIEVVNIFIPSLRERRDDIRPLLDTYLDIYTKHHNLQLKISKEAYVYLEREYPWLGNVRQLKNFIERAVLLKGAKEPATLGLEDAMELLRTTPDESGITPVNINVPKLIRMMGRGEITLPQLHEHIDNRVIGPLIKSGVSMSEISRITGVPRSTLRFRYNR